ncbi:DUF6238 family protein [Streptomyces sp. NPDC056773]|uniref:DUF6238 family protein n=1 Tax=unclassified Streptomyces TaxID=2593676 RepID=UPI0036CEDEDA
MISTSLSRSSLSPVPTPVMDALAVEAPSLPSYGKGVRDEIDRLHGDLLDLASRAAALAAALDRGDYSSAGGRLRSAVTYIWKGSEDLHAAFHIAPPRCAGPQATMARLCGRRMKYIATRVARGAK